MMRFDVFVSYLRHDKAAALELAEALKIRGLRPWLDFWKLDPGERRVAVFKEIVRDVPAVAVLVGQQGIGPWETEEISALLQEYVGRDLPVIPVLLPGTKTTPIRLPLFLKGRTWLDLREGLDRDGIDRLVWGITGEMPRPVPDYPDSETRDLSRSLEEAYVRLENLTVAGEDTAEAAADILKIRRRLREGAQLKAGDFLLAGRIQLLEVIGRGGFAQVWKAYDRSSHSIIAAKVLHPQLAKDQTRRERFFRGARQMAGLQHQGIARVIEQECEDGGYYFFIMEYVEGGDFRRLVLQGNALSQEERLRIVKEVGEALRFAHGRGVVHREVKPGNILIDSQGHPKLTDFDLVRAADTTGGTRTGMLGTFLYSAPELLSRPQEADARADIYGLGMTAIFALHNAELPPTVFRDPPTFIASLNTKAGYQLVLLRAVAWDPEQRWSTVKEFCDALSAASKTEEEERGYVFISYAREDHRTAKKIYQDLKRLSLNPWLDTEDLLPGEPWKFTIISTIKKSLYFLALISEHSVNKNGFVQRELKEGLEVLQNMQPGEVYIIPIRLDKSEPKHDALQELNWIDLFPSYYDAFKKVISVLSPAISKEQLEQLLRDRILAEMEPALLPKLREICSDFSTSETELPGEIFLGTDYGYGFWEIEMEFMRKKQWIEIANGKIRITDKGREAVE